MKKTPLFDIHINEGAKMTEFHGWIMPLNYSAGLLREHENVRKRAGIFDVSHMGEIMVEGKDAEQFLQTMVTNNISGIEDNACIYTPVCYPNGGTVDDILIYKLSGERYMLVVNASNTDKDFEWFSSHVCGDVRVTNVSDAYALLAIQGPLAERILNKLTDCDLSSIRYFRFRDCVSLDGINTLVSRTGYTGEDGFEIYVETGKAEQLWRRIMEHGQEEGLMPAGLGARDTLRLEAGLPLYGNELSEEITPIEAGLSRFVNFEKGDFIGKEILLSQKTGGPGKKLVRFEMVERGIPRSGCSVFAGEKNIGFVTSGSFAPTLGKNIGMALIDFRIAEVEKEIYIEIRNKKLKAAITKKPFYRRGKA